MDKSRQKQLHAVRYYLVDKKALDNLCQNFGDCFLDFFSSEFVETYYDTKGSSLSHLECILMKDTKSMGRYWKFFSFAHDNIFEITTDEKEIREPLSRILNYDTPDCITNDLLQPFFSIRHTTKVYIVDGCRVQMTDSDFGFAYCTIERISLTIERFFDAILAIEAVANKLGLKNLSNYDPKVYL